MRSSTVVIYLHDNGGHSNYYPTENVEYSEIPPKTKRINSSLQAELEGGVSGTAKNMK